MRSNKLFVLLTALVLACFLSVSAFADDYPSKPVTIIVPFGAGGGVDTNTRALAPILEKHLGQKILVENRGGGGGITGHTLGMMAKPDGYTLTMVSTGICTGPWIVEGVQFTPDSYEYIGQVSFVPNFLVVKGDKPYKTVAELVAYAKAHPGKITTPFLDGWTSTSVADAVFRHETGVEAKIVGGFKSGSAKLASVLGGHTDYTFNPINEVLPHKDAGTITILAAAAAERSSFLPDIPTFKELGYNNSVGVFRTLVAPLGTPKPVLDKLTKALKAAMDDPDLEGRFTKVGLTNNYLPPKEAHAFVMEQYESFGKLFDDLGISIKKK